MHYILSGTLLITLLGCSAIGSHHKSSPTEVLPPNETNPTTSPVTSTIISTRSAVQNLYRKSRQNRMDSDLNLAESNLERALRIEPENPFLWFELAQCAYLKNETSKAQELSIKADSLAGNNLLLKQQINSLIGKTK